MSSNLKGHDISLGTSRICRFPSRSTSRPRARESAGHDKGPSRDDGPSSKARDGRHDLSSQARSLASTRLVGIPEDLRQAALAAQKRRQEAEAAAEREREAEAAAAQKAKQAVIDVRISGLSSKLSKFC